MMTGLVLVTINASPRAALNVPSVTRNDGMLSRVVRTPLISPTSGAGADARDRADDPVVGDMRHRERRAMPDSASVDPTDRSICRAMMTKVMPIAMIETSAVCRPMLRKLSMRQKPGRGEAEDDQQDREGDIEHVGPLALQEHAAAKALLRRAWAAGRSIGGRAGSVGHAACSSDDLRKSE